MTIFLAESCVPAGGEIDPDELIAVDPHPLAEIPHFGRRPVPMPGLPTQRRWCGLLAAPEPPRVLKQAGFLPINPSLENEYCDRKSLFLEGGASLLPCAILSVAIPGFAS